MPLHNILNKHTGYSFFVAYGLIVLFETIVFKLFIKSITFLKHLKYILIANLASSLVGSIVVYIFLNDGLDGFGHYAVSYTKVFAIFFLWTVFTEMPVLKFFYKDQKFSKLIRKVLVANVASYSMLFIFQIGGIFYAINSMEREAARNKKEWIHTEILKDIDFEIIFSKNTNSGSKTEVTLINKDNRQVLKEYGGKYVGEVSGDYLIVKEDYFVVLGKLKNWRKNIDLLSTDNTNFTTIISSEDYGLLIFSKRSELQGIPDNGGSRRMYGYSYSVASFNNLATKLNELKNLRLEGIYKYGNEMIYTTHMGCVFSKEESKEDDLVERCAKDPVSTVIMRNESGDEKIILKNATNAILVEDVIYFLNNDNHLEKHDLKTKKTEQIFIKEKIAGFKVSKNQKYLLIETDNHQVFGLSSFLVLIDIEKEKRLIIDEGQIVAYDLVYK